MPALLISLLACNPLADHTSTPPVEPTPPSPTIDTATPPPTTPQTTPTPPPPKRAAPCADDSLAAQPLTSDCVTAEIACGQTIEGHTGGGATGWSDSFYRKHFCTPGGAGYDGPERVYRLPTPPETTVDVRLDSPCADLDLFVLSWPEAGRCPTEAHGISTCESDVSSGGGGARANNLRHGYTYLVAVDGKAGATAPFTLTATCTPR